LGDLVVAADAVAAVELMTSDDDDRECDDDVHGHEEGDPEVISHRWMRRASQDAITPLAPTS
jgi:hypothetical protein